VLVGVKVCEGVRVGVGVGVGVLVGVKVKVGVKVRVGVGVRVGVLVGVKVKVGVDVKVGVLLGVRVKVRVEVGVCVLVLVSVCVGVLLGVKVRLGVSETDWKSGATTGSVVTCVGAVAVRVGVGVSVNGSMAVATTSGAASACLRKAAAPRPSGSTNKASSKGVSQLRKPAAGGLPSRATITVMLSLPPRLMARSTSCLAALAAGFFLTILRISSASTKLHKPSLQMTSTSCGATFS